MEDWRELSRDSRWGAGTDCRDAFRGFGVGVGLGTGSALPERILENAIGSAGRLGVCNKYSLVPSIGVWEGITYRCQRDRFLLNQPS